MSRMAVMRVTIHWRLIMKFAPVLLALGFVFAPAAFAQAPAPATSAASVHAVCKDGTAVDVPTLRGACRGHGGVDKKAGAKAAAPGAAAAAAPAQPAAPAAAAAKRAPAPAVAAAPGGGAGQVWANDSTKVYHCSGDRYYGKTKHGEYMSESAAKAQGMHAARGKACS